MSGPTFSRKALPTIAVCLALAAGAMVYAKRTSKPAPGAGPVRTTPVSVGQIRRTIRISGTIAAERGAGLMAPQLAGNRNGGHLSGNASTSVAGGSTGASNASTAGSSSSSSSSSSNASPSGSSPSKPAPSSLGALRGTTNRFTDRKSSSSSSQSSASGNSSAPNTAGSSSGTSTTGGGSGNGNGNGNGAGGGNGNGNGGAFQLVLLKVAPAGSRVRKGDVIAEFDRQNQINRLDDYKDAVLQISSNIDKLKADLTTAKEAHDQLVRSAKADLDKAELDMKTAPVRSAIEAETLRLTAEEMRARYKQVLAEEKLFVASQRAQLRAAEIDREQSKIELQRAELNLGRMIMKAPMDGVAVMQSIFRGGDFGQVQAGDQIYPGFMFMQVVDPSSMVITALVNQVDAEAIRIGMKATAHIDAYPGVELPAHVAGVGAMSKAGTWRPTYMGQIPVLVKLDNMDARVIPDVSASADIALESREQANVLPLGAVFSADHTEKSGPFVFLQSPSGWEKRPVRLGLADNLNVAIESGVAPGSVVALDRPVPEP